MDILYKLVHGYKGILDRAFRIYGVQVNLHYLQNIKYPAEMEVDLQIVHSELVYFIANQLNKDEEVEDRGILSRHDSITGYICCQDQKRIPVAHQTLLEYDNSTWNIIKVNVQSFKGKNTFIYLKAVR